MNLRKFKFLPFLLALVFVLAACGGATTTEPQTNAEGETLTTENVDLQYITAEELKDNMGDYVLLDVRKAEDYENSHVEGAYAADMDGANKQNDIQDGLDKMDAALNEANAGEDAKYALLCYSGKSYAQAATNILNELGVDPANVYTVEGGYDAWEAGGEEYTDMMTGE